MTMPVSRTKRTIQNSKVSLILFVIQILVGFYSRKIFLEYLGDEVIGLNTTLGNILSFLNLSELGIGMAMATSLYKPIHDNDHDTIVNILSVQGILYKRIAWFLCGMSIPILIAMPYIFPSTECGILYAYVAYLVFLSGSIFSYLWNYRQILIQADQKNFKLMPWIHCVRYSKIFLQIALLMFTPLGIWGWIGAELVGGIVTVFAINHVIRKEYPWLHESQESAKQLLKRYKPLMTKVKQLFVHKIGTFVLHQTSPLIIYAFVSLNTVTYYGNYMMLIGYCMTLMNVIFGGISASIGNLIADNNKQHTIEVFWELFTSRIWIAGIACFGVYIFVGPFITLWLGSRYVFGESTLLLLILYMFIQIFGYLWGLNGVLMGVNLSLIIIILLWKPYYTFRHGLKSPVLPYYIQYAFHTGVLIIGAMAAKWTMTQFNYEHGDFITLAFVLLLGMIVFIITTYAILMLSTKGMRMFTKRIKNILARKI